MSVEGTSNATISSNVGFKNAGHCIYIGYQSESNIISNNLVSGTNSMKPNEALSGETDASQASAFVNMFHPNTYTHNIATGGIR